MSATEVNTGLTAPFAAVALLGSGGATFGGTLLESGNMPVNLNTLESLASGNTYTVILGSGVWFPLNVS
jgi:hypothetical protein